MSNIDTDNTERQDKKINQINQENEYAMYILVNKDLGMSPGKIAAQVAHVAEMWAEEIMREFFEGDDSSENFIWWQMYSRHGRKKVILYAKENDLYHLKEMDDAKYIIDEGRTEIPPNSLTVVGFIPRSNNKDRFKKFRLI